MEQTPYSNEWREQQQRKGRRRWGWWMLGTGLAAGIAGPMITGLTGGQPSNTHRHRESGLALGVTLALLLLLLVFIAYMYRRAFTARSGFWSAVPLMQLPWRQRRKVAKEMRRGQLDSDPYVAELQYESAKRLFRQTKVTVVVFVAFSALAIWLIFEARTSGMRVSSVIELVIFLLILGPFLYVARRGARQVIEQYERSYGSGSATPV